MPVCADPNATVPLWLKRDEKIPEDQRPTFLVQFLTDMEYRQLRNLLKDVLEEKDEKKAADMIEQALRIGIVGCRNLKFRGQPLEFAQIERFGKHFTSTELSELAYGQIKVVTLGERDRFFSESQRDSVQEKSAQDAPADAAK